MKTTMNFLLVIVAMLVFSVTASAQKKQVLDETNKVVAVTDDGTHYGIEVDGKLVYDKVYTGGFSTDGVLTLSKDGKVSVFDLKGTQLCDWFVSEKEIIHTAEGCVELVNANGTGESAFVYYKDWTGKTQITYGIMESMMAEKYKNSDNRIHMPTNYQKKSSAYEFRTSERGNNLIDVYVNGKLVQAGLITAQLAIPENTIATAERLYFVVNYSGHYVVISSKKDGTDPKQNTPYYKSMKLYSDMLVECEMHDNLSSADGKRYVYHWVSGETLDSRPSDPQVMPYYQEVLKRRQSQ